MQRRSSGRAPRKSYTVDAFDSVPELRDTSRSPSHGQESEQDVFDAEQDANPSDDEISDLEAADVSEIEAAVSDDAESDAEAGKVRSVRISTKTSKPTSKIHFNRRLQDHFRTSSKEDRRNRLFGPAAVDAAPTLAALSRWAKLSVLPARTEKAPGKGGFCLHQVATQAGHDLHHTEWLWYFEHGGQQRVQERQALRAISSQEAEAFLPSSTDSTDFLIGSIESPVHHNLSSLQAIPLAKAWQQSKTEQRNGYMLNAGARVKTAQWLPCNPDNTQYLAVTILPDRKAEHAPFESPSAPAYTAQLNHKAAMQIWQIPTATSKAPARLSAALCTSWGDFKAFEFCTIPCTVRKDRPHMLAIISGDGKLRMIELPPSLLDGECEPVFIDQAAIELAAPDTIFTCVTFATPRLLVATTANGCMAVIDVHEALQQEHQQKPFRYASISDTYIHGITSCQPSHPALIITISMDGHLRLTDVSQPSLSAPDANAQSARLRSVLPTIVWSDIAQSAFMTEDNFYVRAYAIRRVYSQFHAGRTKSTATASAVSPCHPFLLLGTTGGEAVTTNTLSRLLNTKSHLYMQTWFSHEWRGAQPGDDARESELAARITNNGISRFTEGYRTDPVIFKEGDGNARSITAQTIYEKKTAVTAVAWCPNMVAAGWAAAGLADGLIRVEDIALSR